MRWKQPVLLLSLLMAVLFSAVSASPVEAAGGCTPYADFELDSYGYVQVSHRAYCGYAKYYATIIVQHGLQVDGKSTVLPDAGALYRGPTTGAAYYPGYGTSARNLPGTQQFCAWTKVTWQYIGKIGGQKYAHFCASY